MNWIDFGIIVLVLYYMALGFRKGILRGALDLVGIIAVLMIALTQFRVVADLLSDLLSTSSSTVRWLSFLLCLGVLMAVVNALTRLVGYFTQKTGQTVPDRLVGAFFGMLRGAFIVSLMLILVISFPFSSSFKSQIDQSSLAPSALSIIPIVYDAFILKVVPGSRPFVDQLNQHLKESSATPVDLTSAPGSPERPAERPERPPGGP
jgi:membrane protein required for colicin V production